MNDEKLLTILEVLLDRPVAFHRGLKKSVKGATTQLMLSQAIYWSKIQKHEDGWFYKTQTEWEEETNLTRREQETARKQLKTKAFWQEERRGLCPKLYFRVDLILLAKDLAGDDTPIDQSLSEMDILHCTKSTSASDVKTRIPHCTNPPSGKVQTVHQNIYTKNTYKDYKDVEPHTDFSDFKNLYNSEKSRLWAACEILSQVRINLIKRLIKDVGSHCAALEVLEKACKFGREDKFWGAKRFEFDTILRKAISLSEKYLETPNGHVISESDISMAARMKETQELADRLAKKYNYNGANNA
jgi:hypothetical protein